MSVRVVVGVVIAIIILILLGAFLVYWFFYRGTRFPHILPINPPRPPPDCTPKMIGCDYSKFCMQYQNPCNHSIDCKPDAQCQQKFVWKDGILGSLKNLSTGSQVVSYMGLANTIFVMWPSDSTVKGAGNLVILKQGPNILAKVGTTYAYMTVDSNNNIQFDAPAKAVNFYYNEVTGQIVDDLQNPKMQVSLATDTYNNITVQKLFVELYSPTPTARNIWLFAPSS